MIPIHICTPTWLSTSRSVSTKHYIRASQNVLAQYIPESPPVDAAHPLRLMSLVPCATDSRALSLSSSTHPASCPPCPQVLLMPHSTKRSDRVLESHYQRRLQKGVSNLKDRKGFIYGFGDGDGCLKAGRAVDAKKRQKQWGRACPCRKRRWFGHIEVDFCHITGAFCMFCLPRCLIISKKLCYTIDWSSWHSTVREIVVDTVCSTFAVHEFHLSRSLGGRTHIEKFRFRNPHLVWKKMVPRILEDIREDIRRIHGLWCVDLIAHFPRKLISSQDLIIVYLQSLASDSTNLLDYSITRGEGVKRKDQNGLKNCMDLDEIV